MAKREYVGRRKYFSFSELSIKFYSDFHLRSIEFHDYKYSFLGIWGPSTYDIGIVVGGGNDILRSITMGGAGQIFRCIFWAKL